MCQAAPQSGVIEILAIAQNARHPDEAPWRAVPPSPWIRTIKTCVRLQLDGCYGIVLVEAEDVEELMLKHPNISDVHYNQATAKMLLLGLTGSIATGKSTVSSVLAAPPYNLPIVDADKVARQVVEPGTYGYNQIVSTFASSTPDLLVDPTPENGGENGPNGKGRPLNRPALGRRVFGEGKDEDKKKLNAIVHPAVRREMYKQMLFAYLRGNWACVLDVPLLFESGWEPLCGTILVVGVSDPAIQMQRLRARDEHLTEEDAKNRVAAQWDVRDKAKRCLRRGSKAGVVVWNDGDRADLKKQIDAVMATVKSGSPQWWAWLLLLCPPLAVASGAWHYVRGWWIKKQWESEQVREKARL